MAHVPVDAFVDVFGGRDLELGIEAAQEREVLGGLGDRDLGTRQEFGELLRGAASTP